MSKKDNIYWAFCKEYAKTVTTLLAFSATVAVVILVVVAVVRGSYLLAEAVANVWIPGHTEVHVLLTFGLLWSVSLFAVAIGVHSWNTVKENEST